MRIMNSVLDMLRFCFICLFGFQLRPGAQRALNWAILQEVVLALACLSHSPSFSSYIFPEPVFC